MFKKLAHNNFMRYTFQIINSILILYPLILSAWFKLIYVKHINSVWKLFNNDIIEEDRL